MRPMSLVLSCALLLTASLAVAQDGHFAEVSRLGDTVQHIDGKTYGQTTADVVVNAMAPPATDDDKWFISIVATRNCAGCIRLRNDWAKDANLLALANPNDSKKSWAHFNYYYRDDKSQAFRFKGLKFEAFPTILVQPPRNGKYGDPATVVYQATYDGKPRDLASDIASSIRYYVTRICEDGGKANPHTNTNTKTPPWEPAPRDEADIDAGGRLIPPKLPEEVAVEVDFPWKALFTLLTVGFSVPSVIALVIWLLVFLRAGRKASDKTTLLDDATFQKLLELLEGLSESTKVPRKKPPVKRRTKKVKASS